MKPVNQVPDCLLHSLLVLVVGGGCGGGGWWDGVVVCGLPALGGGRGIGM